MAKNDVTTEVSGWRAAVPRYLTFVLRLASCWALLDGVISWLTPPLHTVFSRILLALGLPAEFSIFNAVVLFILSVAVQHRRRIALWATLFYFQLPSILIGSLGIGIFFLDNHPIEDTDGGFSTIGLGDFAMLVATVVLSIVVSVILIMSRKAFPTRTGKGAWWRALVVVVSSLVLAIIVGFAVLEIFYHPSGTPLENLSQIAISVVSKFGYALPLNGLFFKFNSHSAFWVELSTSLIVIAGLLGTAGFFIRSTHRELHASPQDQLQLRRLLLRFGQQDSLGYFNTRTDKSVIFSDDGQAAVVYRLIGSVLLASGDPVGDRASWQGAVKKWLALASLHGWTPAATGTTPEATALYRRMGLTSTPLGDEAVIEVENFSLADTQMRDVQRAVRKATQAEYTVSIRRQGDVAVAELSKLNQLADQWRQGGPERGFSMASGRFADPTDNRVMVVVAHDRAGEPRGLLSFVPWGPRGLSLDLMRRSPDSINGVTSFMIASLVEECRDLGIREIGLNFAVMRRVFEAGEQVEATSLQRTTRRIMLFFSRWWQLESLYRSNEIYQPQWHPRMLCWARGASLIEVLIAMGKAEGFVPEGISSRIDRVLARRSAASIDEDKQAHAALVTAIHADEAAADNQSIQAALPRVTGYTKARREMLDKLRNLGIDPYPITVEHSDTVAEVVARHKKSADPNESDVAVVGRIVRIRHHGGLCFADIRGENTEIQAMLDRRIIDQHAGSHPETFSTWKRFVRRGDIVSVHGDVTRSRSGELSLAVDRWQLASKSLQPMPDKRYGITDPETRIRKREVDIATSASAYDMVHNRSAILTSIRDTFRARDYIEVETPMLQAIHGGANARPFHTHSNAYDINLSLRIAPELALKRLLVGGVDKIFEMGRNFRNEGTSFKHNPEFTSIEAYEFYTDYVYQMELTREAIVNAAIAIHGEPIAIRPDGSRVDIGGQWPVVPIYEAVSKATGVAITSSTSAEEIQRIYRNLGINAPAGASAADLMMGLYDRLVEGQTDVPTFYTDIPVELAPLVRPHRDNPTLTEKWDLVVFGLELGTGSTELIDPVDQRDRFTEQSLRAAAGDPEAMEIDEDFLSALEFGLRPLGGLGIGVDRLVMTLTGSTIRQTLAFPFVRPKQT